MNFISNMDHKINKNLVLIVTLVAIIMISIGNISDIVAQENPVIIVTLDSKNYNTGQILNIQGSVLDVKMPVIALTIHDPDGKTLQASNLDITNNTFVKTIPLDSPFYDKSGQYTIKLSYGKIVQEIFFEIIGVENNDNKDTSQKDSAKTESENSVTAVEITSLVSASTTYYDGDTVIISGTVSSTVNPTVLIGIHDPFGSPAGFYFGMINDDKFTISFMVKSGVNFKADGTYYAKAHYGESEKIVEFDFSKKTPMKQEEQFDEEQSTKNEQTNMSDTNNNIDAKTEPRQTDNENTSEIKPESKPRIISQPKQETTSESRNTDKNLTVEDLELGIMLNEINLKCDTEKLKDLTTYYDGMGPSLSQLCKYSDAIQYYLDDLTNNSKDVDALTNLGSAFFHLGYYSDSLREYDTALSISPNHISALNNKANLLSKTGMNEDAMELYIKALELSPTNTIIKRNMLIVQLTIQSQINDEITVINQTTVNDIDSVIIPQDVGTKNSTLYKQSDDDSVSVGNIFSDIISAISSFFNPSD
ncbi:MAG: tetratricopeptide repeat protein [Nitrosopumilus sp.]|nr:tetratricopeptide repeat protein [Nitrosopumilus sp.]NRA05643.1 tetratricopeptide repeat protein [Nitrosopumilus sp.]